MHFIASHSETVSPRLLILDLFTHVKLHILVVKIHFRFLRTLCAKLGHLALTCQESKGFNVVFFNFLLSHLLTIKRKMRLFDLLHLELLILYSL